MEARYLLACSLAALLSGACGNASTVSDNFPTSTAAAPAAADEDIHPLDDALAPTEEEEAEYLKVLDLELADGEDLAGRLQVPAQVDLSKQAPPPSNQYRLGSCAGFAYGYGLGTATASNGTRDVYQANNQVSPAYAYRAALDYDNFQGLPVSRGVHAADVLTPMVVDGSASYAAVPYPQVNDAQQAAQAIVAIPLNQASPDFLVGSWQLFPTRGQELLADVKERLATGQVVGFETELYPGFYNVRGPEVFSSSAAPLPRSYHAMLIVGYDDNLSYQDDQGETRSGALRVQNSWGSRWGDNGYFWLAYDTFLRTQRLRAFLATPVQKIAPPVQPTGCRLTVEPADGPEGQVTSVVQDQYRQKEALVVNYRFSDAINISNVTLGAADQALRAIVRNGQLYWVRQDGHSYQPGPTTVTIRATTTYGKALTYTGNVNVPDIPGLTPAPPPAVEQGTNGQDPP